VIGLIKDQTGSSIAGLMFLAALILASFAMTYLVRLEDRSDAVEVKPAT